MDERDRWTGHLTEPAQVCYFAEGWICVKHPEHPWPHPSPEESDGQCAGPGMPCPRCQPGDGRPRFAVRLAVDSTYKRLDGDANANPYT